MTFIRRKFEKKNAANAPIYTPTAVYLTNGVYMKRVNGLTGESFLGSGVYGPQGLYDFNFFPVNRTFD